MLGHPSFDGFSEKVTAAPLAAVRRTSAASTSGSQMAGSEQGINRPGCAAPVVDVPVVVRPHHGQRDVLVLGPGEELAAELGERREAQRAEDAAASMSFTRWSMS